MGKKSGSNILKVIIPLAILLVLTLVGRKTGLFYGIDRMVFINVENIIQIIVAIAFVQVLGGILLMIFNSFRHKTGRVGTISTLAASVTRYAMILIEFCWVLSIIGVNVSTIFASIGILALIIGFGAESLVADIVTGVFILFENEYNIGDIIEVDGFRGSVKEVGIRTVSLEDAGGNIKIINNSDLKNIINRSNHGSKAVCDIGVSYSTDLDAIEETIGVIIEEIKAKYPNEFASGIQYLGVENLGDFCVTLRFMAEVNENDIFTARRILNKELKTAFDKHNISIPFPRLEVYSK